MAYEFKGAKSILLFNIIQKQLLVIYSFGLARYEDYLSFNDFLKENLKTKELAADIVKYCTFEKEELNVILSFAKDTNNIPYSSLSIEGLDVGKIKTMLEDIIFAFNGQDIFF
jgi:hypothetical protein